MSTCRTGRKTPASEVPLQEVFSVRFAAERVEQRLLERHPGRLKHSLTHSDDQVDRTARLTNTQPTKSRSTRVETDTGWSIGK